MQALNFSIFIMSNMFSGWSVAFLVKGKLMIFM